MRRRRRTLLPSLRAEGRALIERGIEFGRRYAIDLFLVGGAVRDLYLGEEVCDLDLVWVGDRDSADVSRTFGEFLESEISYHPEFLTASLRGPGGLRLDLGRARSETYATPAAMPSVRPAGLTEDLKRRDFSVNAMAVPLQEPGSLIDPCAGFADLERRQLRTLHALSFRDDPTRILRGLELAVRRGFQFDPRTRAQAERAVREGTLGRVSGARVRHELARLLDSPERAAPAAESLRGLALDRALDEGFRIDERGLERLRRLAVWKSQGPDSVPPEVTPFWIVALTVLLWDRPKRIRRALADRLSLGRGGRRWLEDVPERLGELLRAGLEIESSVERMVDLYTQLSPGEVQLLGLFAVSGPAEQLRRARRLASVELGIGGRDLLAAGIAPGPGLGAALEATLAARRSGAIEADEELHFAVEWLRRKDLDGG